MSVSTTWTAAEVDVFFAGYLATALWTSTDDAGESLDGLHQVDDLTDAARQELRAEVADFIQANAADLSGLKPMEAGNLFWLSRNGHGTGFWDAGLGDLGDRLHAAAKVYGGVDLYVGDDGRIHV